MFATLRAALVATTLLVPTSFAVAQSVPESADPIKITLNDWTGQFTSARIAGELLKSMSYNIEYVSAGAVPSSLASPMATSTSSPRSGTI